MIAMQNGLNSLPMAVRVMEKVLYSSYTLDHHEVMSKHLPVVENDLVLIKVTVAIAAWARSKYAYAWADFGLGPPGTPSDTTGIERPIHVPHIHIYHD